MNDILSQQSLLPACVSDQEAAAAYAIEAENNRVSVSCSIPVLEGEAFRSLREPARRLGKYLQRNLRYAAETAPRHQPARLLRQRLFQGGLV